MIIVRTPSRLHFGLLAFDPSMSRQFGGVGLMINQPDTLIHLTPAKEIAGSGRMSDRATIFATRFMTLAKQAKLIDEPLGVHIDVKRIARPHTGFGSGTQLGMAVARGLAEYIGHPHLSVSELARMVERGQRSAIGAHGFVHGGFIVEGGKASANTLSPLLIRHDFPETWRVLLIRPKKLEGCFFGRREEQAFSHELSIPSDVSAQLCQLVLLGMAPALVEQDLNTFGQALHELQQRIGDCFAVSQGGRWADDSLEPVVAFIRQQGIFGVGQSSWGPTMYAICESNDQAEHLAEKLTRAFQFNSTELCITAADNHGGVIRQSKPTTAT